MAVRYSGDVEIRLTWDPKSGTYQGLVVSPDLRWKGSVLPGFITPRERRSSDAYDHAARRLAAEAQRWAKKRGKHFPFVTTPLGATKTDRVFQSPCPLDDLTQPRRPRRKR